MVSPQAGANRALLHPLTMEMRFLIFFLIVVGILAGGHAWIGMRLIPLLPLSPLAHKLAWAGLWLLLLLVLSSLFLSRGPLGNPLIDVWILVGQTWLGVALLLLTATAVGDLLSLLPGDGWKPAMRGSLYGLALLASLWAVLSSRLPPVIHDVEVRIPDLPQEFEGYRIAHITDTHIGPVLRTAWTKDLVKRVNQAHPDLVVHTGDLADGSVAQVGAYVRPLVDLQASDGVLYVTGNHEAYHDVQAWSAQIPSLHMQELVNQHAVVSRGNTNLIVAGVTDRNEGAFVPERAPDAKVAFQGAPQGVRILLAHQPAQAADAQGLGVALQLSGHTHGGQIWPFHYLVRLQQPVVSGFGQVGDVLVFVSNGAGFWGPAMRLFARAEVPVLVLHAQ